MAFEQDCKWQQCAIRFQLARSLNGTDTRARSKLNSFLQMTACQTKAAATAAAAAAAGISGLLKTRANGSSHNEWAKRKKESRCGFVALQSVEVKKQIEPLF